jgi:diguanylate cyclase (GGDEF)-like protein
MSAAPEMNSGHSIPERNADMLADARPGIFKDERALSDRIYRFIVYGLLAVLIGSGLTLSLVMTRTARTIRTTAVPLLREKIVLLEDISNFQEALLRHQLAISKYANESIGRDRFLTLWETSREEMEKYLAALDKDSVLKDPALKETLSSVHDTYQALNIAIAPYKNISLASDVDREKMKMPLVFLNINTNRIRDQLDVLKQYAEQNVYRSEDAASASIYTITFLIYLFSTGIFITGLFMIYHVWARFRSEDELAYQASHDPLTGLAHRRSFEAKLRTLGAGEYTIALGRIDRFERVIEGLGHRMGDHMMQQITARIRQVAEKHGGEVFRLDGANIAILYKLCKKDRNLDIALSAMCNDMHPPFSLGRHEIFSSLSLGTAEYPGDGTDHVQLLRNADAALKAAHDAGGDRHEAYTSELNAKANDRLLVEAALGYAIDRHELELYYQPQQCLTSGRLHGFEALIRWRHDGKLISPRDFIPLAEESGLIVELGDWVFAQACTQAKKWNDEFGPGLVIAVNISPRQFLHRGFLAKITDTLTRTQVDPNDIELEITEGMVMHGADQMISLLTSLRKLGLKLAIDDFGTGYSSLSYLTRFPVNRLKIDQSFVKRLGLSKDVSIVQAAIQLGHNLGIEVIAEGVETEIQRACLRCLSCDQIQGYFYGHPLAVAKATNFIQNNIPGDRLSA